MTHYESQEEFDDEIVKKVLEEIVVPPGDLGPTGPQGEQGEQGPKGEEGKIGPEGPEGKQGVQGEKGEDGKDGEKGNNGDNGSPDTAEDIRDKLESLKGKNRLDKDAIKGLEEEKKRIDFAIGVLDKRSQFLINKITISESSGGGATGPQGATGPVGPQGTQGSIGIQGPQGTQGSIGVQGPQGTQGSIGLQGPQGTQGTQGSLGANGATGATGPTGYVAPRVVATASTIGPAPNADTTDIYQLTAQAGTAGFTGPAGTPVNGQKLMIEILATGSNRNITWGDSYIAGGVVLPTVAVLATRLTVGFEYDTSNSLNKWLCIASSVPIPGVQGTQGTQGSIGLQGTQGSIGVQGLQGTQGTQGSIGLRGTQGTGVNPRKTYLATAGSGQPNADTTDIYVLTAQGTRGDFKTPSGTPTMGQRLEVVLWATGPGATITWATGYTAGGVTLPAIGVQGKRVQVCFEYDTSNAFNTWMAIGKATQI